MTNKGKKKVPSGTRNQQIKELEKQVKENLEGWQRAKADYLNYRKKTEKQKAELIKYCNEDLILKFLPIIDSFDLAIANIPKENKSDNWTAGVIAIENMLLNVLRDSQIEEIKTKGQKFDPELHEAVEDVKNKNFKTGEIVSEIARGFKLNGRVVRATKVKVAK